MKQIHIEFQRVQTWLFLVPKLRAMVGANALLGETLRVALPKLARETRTWSLKPATETYPCLDPNDPLEEHDDPAADARDGILSRDGGHFEALFSSGAEAFAHEAASLLHGELPGIRFRISIDGAPWTKSAVHLSTELPVLAPCEWTGRGVSSVDVQQGDERASVSLDVEKRHKAAKRAEDGKASDLASLLVATTKLKCLGQPHTFKELVGNGYLALIHADGNDVGRSAAVLTGAKRAVFYHKNRVLLRRAVQRAVDTACESASQAPLIPLMLGGDDLLLACRAATALPFVVALCQTLADLQSDDASTFKLTLGVGVVFAKHTIPIHRIHQVAEQLASSAKRRFRGFDPEESRSVVDWAVYTTAWVDDPEEVRRRDWIRGEGRDLRVLSQRPVDVLGWSLDSLQGLVAAANQLKETPRSQLRYLVEQLSRGKALSDLAFEELSEKARFTLKRLGVNDVWKRSTDNNAWLTDLLDLIELFEIGRLGQASDAQEVAYV